MIAAGATVRWSKGIAMFKIRATMRGSARFAVVSTGTALGSFTVIATGAAVRGSAGFAVVAATAIPLPGFTHSFKTLTQLFAFLLTHVVPSLPHGGTQGGP